MVAGFGWLENWTRQKPVLGDSSQRRLERRNISNYFLQMEQSHCLDEVRFPKIQQGKEHNDVPQGESDGSQPSDTVEKLDASEIYRRRINAKEVLISQKKGEDFIFQIADGTAKLFRRSHGVREYRRTSRKLGKVSTDRIKR